jgi:DNA repair exonuclease SbcCD ATPase subunit
LDVRTLITILREREGGVEELAEAVVESARESTVKSLTATFGVALGTGDLSKARAEQLYDALKRRSGAQSLEGLSFSGHPAVAELRSEVAELTDRHERLRYKQASLAARQEAVSNLEAELAAARRKVSTLEAELEALRERAARLDALCEEGDA